MGVPNKFIANLLPNMIDDMLKWVVDPLFPPQNKQEDRENGFELIYCTHHSKLAPKPFNKRSDFSLVNLYPIKELTQPMNPSKRILKKSILS